MGALSIAMRTREGGSSLIAFGPLSELGSSLDPTKTVVVTDRLIRRIYGSSFPACPVVEVERGEAAKSLSGLEALYGSFLDLGLGRDALVLAVGGGTVSDLAGFAASTWLRGVAFGFVPTTLLAMVDASVGGKNGIDFRGVKNLIGSFSQPRFVRMDIALLASLSGAEFASGMAEAVKHAVIAGGAYFELVEESARAGGRPSPELLERIVAGSVEIKAGVVARDEKEAGERRKLNLGHSVGHGVEAATGLPHGHSVAAGLGTACRLAVRLGRLAEADCDRITRLLEACGLPASIAAAGRAAAGSAGDGSALGSAIARDGLELRKAIAAAMTADKKRVGADIMMALPSSIGEVAVEAVPLADLQAFVMEAP
jgi:3-dehydroquinate synthase